MLALGRGILSWRAGRPAEFKHDDAESIAPQNLRASLPERDNSMIFPRHHLHGRLLRENDSKYLRSYLAILLPRAFVK